jgi:hypothetical protein
MQACMSAETGAFLNLPNAQESHQTTLYLPLTCADVRRDIGAARVRPLVGRAGEDARQVPHGVEVFALDDPAVVAVARVGGLVPEGND